MLILESSESYNFRDLARMNGRALVARCKGEDSNRGMDHIGWHRETGSKEARYALARQLQGGTGQKL